DAMGATAAHTPPPTLMGVNGAAAMRATKQPTLQQSALSIYDSVPPPPPMPGPPPIPGPPGATPPPMPGAPPMQGPSVAAGNPGRLVVLSSNFGGREFVLAKPTMVIGRTDENDIVVNHRSISRHHAKVVLEQGRYCIVDLQSANGVRVNGEEYGKVELRPGDVVDLGHVRMRYVDPTEDFVFERDAQIVDVGQLTQSAAGGKSKGVLLALPSV